MKRSRRAEGWTVGHNYDGTDVHLRYDKARALPAETMSLWLDTISKLVPRDSIETIIDVGCGTGRFSGGLSEHLSANVCGIDPSWKMSSAARRTVTSPRIQFVQASAENLPLNDGVADMVFLSQVYHHIQDKDKALREFRRVLKPGGFVCIRTATVETLDSCLYLRFFPHAREIADERMPSREGLKAFFRQHRFAIQVHAVVNQRFSDNLEEYVDKASLRGTSDLIAITDREFEKGLRALKQYCAAQNSAQPVLEDIDLFIFRKASNRGTSRAACT